MSAINESVNMLKKIIKFDEFSNEKALNVICKITPAMGRLFSDEEVLNAYSDRLNPNELKEQGLTDKEIKVKLQSKAAENLSKLVVLVLEKHRNDIYIILAALNEKTIEEVSNQSPIETLEQTSEFLNHEYLMGFLE